MAKKALAEKVRALINASFGVLILLQLQVDQAFAWGADGHRITCLIAQPLLYEPTEKAVAELLPKSANASLASFCTWPDDIRWMNKYKWTKELHYVDTPDLACRYDYNRDCHDSEGTMDMCVSGAINNFTEELSAYTKKRPQNNQNMTEAMMFLAHFVGDIHQPMHTAFQSDAGGNNITVYWYNRKSNLHHVWDTEIVDKDLTDEYNSDITAMTDGILNDITDTWASEADAWRLCHNNKIACPDTYATEGVNLACKWAYKGATAGTALGDEYYSSRLPLVKRRLAQGGVRLAAILNKIFDPNAPQQTVSRTWKSINQNFP